MNKKLKYIVITGLLIAMAYAGYNIISYYKDAADFEKAQSTYEEDYQAWDMSISQEELDSMSDGEKNIARFRSFKKKYPAALGWINIPGTNISYPYAQGPDNDYYLWRDLEGNDHRFGTIFLDEDNAQDFSDDNTTIYGHNIRYKVYFHQLMKYREPSFFEEAPLIEISTENSFYKYEIFAVYPALPNENYNALSYSGEPKTQLEEMIRSRNEVKGNVPKDFTDMLTLQTCIDEDDRLIIHAKLISKEDYR